MGGGGDKVASQSFFVQMNSRLRTRAGYWFSPTNKVATGNLPASSSSVYLERTWQHSRRGLIADRFARRGSSGCFFRSMQELLCCTAPFQSILSEHGGRPIRGVPSGVSGSPHVSRQSGLWVFFPSPSLSGVEPLHYIFRLLEPSLPPNRSLRVPACSPHRLLALRVWSDFLDSCFCFSFRRTSDYCRQKPNKQDKNIPWSSPVVISALSVYSTVCRAEKESWRIPNKNAMGRSCR